MGRLYHSISSIPIDLRRTSSWAQTLSSNCGGLQRRSGDADVYIGPTRPFYCRQRTEIPTGPQKVGASNFQLQGYYLSKLLDMEKHLSGNTSLKTTFAFYGPLPAVHTGDEAVQANRNSGSVEHLLLPLDRNKIAGYCFRVNLQAPEVFV